MKNIVYLDNASSSWPKPKQVAKAVAATIETVANPGRGGHKMAVKAMRIIFEARDALADLMRLSNPERIIFTGSATMGANLALNGLLRKGDTVAVSRMEHNAVLRPLAALEKRGVIVEYAPADKNGLPDPAKIPDVKMIVTVAGSNVNGAVAQVEKLAKACRAKGVLLMLDAAQTAGSVPLNHSGADIVVCAGHKGLLGPQGTGFVWFAPGVEPEPVFFGGTGSDSQNRDMPAFWPDRHEPGTLNTPGIAGLKAACAWLGKKGIADVYEHEKSLCGRIIETLGNEPGINLHLPKNRLRSCSIVSFNVKGLDPAAAANLLDRENIACRVGLHCSPEAHRHMGTFPEGTVRLSPGAFTKKGDVEKFIKILKKAVLKT